MKPFLIITGMHRSGTSFLARALNLCGVYLGPPDSIISNEWEVREDNLRGHWENAKLLDLTDRTLAYNNGNWYSVPENITISKELGNEIRNRINELTSYPCLGAGFKDPRMSLCLESWRDYLPNDFLVIGIFREPRKVAESLKKRNSFDYQNALELWKIYNQKLLYILEKHNGFLLNFDWPKERLVSEIDLILDKLGFPRYVDLQEWYSDELLHSDKTYDLDYHLPSDIDLLYEKLQVRSEKNREVKVKKIEYSPIELLDIIGGFLLDIKNQAKYFTKLYNDKKNIIEKVQLDIADLQSSIQQKESQIADLQSSIQQKESQIADLQSSIQQKESQIADLQSSIQQKESQIADLQENIEKIQQSFTWKILRKYDRSIARFYSMREKS